MRTMIYRRLRDQVAFEKRMSAVRLQMWQRMGLSLVGRVRAILEGVGWKTAEEIAELVGFPLEEVVEALGVGVQAYRVWERSGVWKGYRFKCYRWVSATVGAVGVLGRSARAAPENEPELVEDALAYLGTLGVLVGEYWSSSDRLCLHLEAPIYLAELRRLREEYGTPF